ncbi:MAG: hypothetical protein DI537_34690 [Stutzerimonas stutzeri]|nr:MAG: hypothetical protein DI537_34690 [Stutzerimonas stutzeri]
MERRRMTGVVKKVVKAAAIVAGIALAIPSGGSSLLAVTLAVSGTAALGIAAGLAVTSSLLAGRPKAPSVSASSTERLEVSINVRAPRAMVFGKTAMATDLRDQEASDDQSYLHRFIVTAAHKVQSIDEIWFDDKMAWSATGGVTSDYTGYLTVTPRTEGSAANAINLGARMGSSRRYTGCAYVYLRYKLTGNTKKSESPFATAIPTRVTIIGKGAAVYDPRLDSTVPGGSGPQRADDQTTWAWNDDAARNPALQMLWHMLGWRIRNPVTGEWLLSVGKGIPARRIDLASFITAANLCDEPVTLAAGGTEPRYRSDGVFSEADDSATVLDQLKAAMNAELDDVDGRLRVTVLHNDLATPIADLGTDDIISAFAWRQTAPLDETFNIIRGTWVDPASLYQTPDYPQVEIDSPDGIDRIETINFSMVQSVSQVQRLAKQRLARMLYSGTFSATFSHRAWKVAKNDVIRLSFSPLGWTNRLFRVVETGVQVNGQVPMALRVEHPDIYLWDNDERPAVQPAAATTYDPYLNPTGQDARNPSYSDGTPIDNLRPAEPGATDGMNPSEEALLAALDADIAQANIDIAAAQATIAEIQADVAADLADFLTTIDGLDSEVDTLSTTVATYGASITENATAISTLQGDLAELTVGVNAGTPNLISGGFENGLSPWTAVAGDWQYRPRATAVYGPHAYILSPTGTVILQSESAPASAGKQYTVSGRMRFLGGTGDVYFDMLFLDASGALVSGGDPGNGPLYPPGTEFDSEIGGKVNRTHGAFTATAPTGTAKVVARAVGESLSGVSQIAVQQVKLEIGDKPGDYSSEASVIQTYTALASTNSLLASLDTTVATLGSTVSTNSTAITTMQGNVATLTQRVSAGNPNLLRNPTFAEGTTYWAGDGYGGWEANTAAASNWGCYAVTNTDHPSGTNHYLFQDVGPLEYDYHTVSADMGQFISGGAGFHSLAIQWWDGVPGTGTYKGETPWNSRAASENFDATGATRAALKVTAYPPAGITTGIYARVVLYWQKTSGTSTSCHARQVKFERGQAITTFSSEATIATTYQALSTLSTQYASLSTTVSTQGVTITSQQTAITTLNSLFGKYGVEINVNGYVTGFALNNNGGRGDFAILQDRFSIVAPGGGARTEYSNGNWRVYDASGVLRVRMGVW